MESLSEDADGYLLEVIGNAWGVRIVFRPFAIPIDKDIMNAPIKNEFERMMIVVVITLNWFIIRRRRGRIKINIFYKVLT